MHIFCQIKKKTVFSSTNMKKNAGVSEGDMPPSEVEDFFFKLMDFGHTFCQIKKKNSRTQGVSEGGMCPPQKLKIFMKLMDRWPDLVHSFAKLKKGVSEGDMPPSEVEDFFFKLMDFGHTFCHIKKKKQ